MENETDQSWALGVGLAVGICYAIGQLLIIGLALAFVVGVMSAAV
jgi:hypothetical protein